MVCCYHLFVVFIPTSWGKKVSEKKQKISLFSCTQMKTMHEKTHRKHLFSVRLDTTNPQEA